MKRALLTLTVLLPACVGFKDLGLGEGEGEGEAASIEKQSSSLSYDAGELGALEIEIDSDMTAFLVTAQGASYVAVDSIVDPDGDKVFDWEDWYYESTTLTEAIFPWYHDMQLNWPVREDDGKLSRGTWTVYLGSYSASGRSKADDLDITVHEKRDDSFSKGTIGVRIVYADGMKDDSEVVDGVEGAVEIWRDIWSAYGITLDEEYAESDIDPALSSPSDSTSAIEKLAKDTNGRQITVIIGETIDGGTDYYGVTGSIPGPLSATPRAGIVISWLANAGGDGSFSEDDIRLFGETLAHESGHFLGMFHPVEYGWNAWDALGDTEKCTKQSTCEDDLGDNLMFPYPVCSFRDCVPQQELTDEQVGVVMRYTGTK